MDELTTQIMPQDTRVQAHDLIRTTIEPGVFRVTRELNGSFVIVEAQIWMTVRENGKYHRRRTKVERHIPRASITEIRRAINNGSS